MGTQEAATLERTTAELEGLLTEVWGSEATMIDPDLPIRSLGVDSSTLVAFLGRVEQEYGMDWGADVPASALSTVRSIANLIVDQGHARA